LKEFTLPLIVYNVVFLQSNKLVILSDKGFMLLDHLTRATLPSPIPIFATMGPEHNPLTIKLAERCTTCRPIGHLSSHKDEFLLCYERFGLYVDLNGRPSRSAATFEWQDVADRVVDRNAYFLLFNKRFIEVRHLESGAPVQFIVGNDIQRTWDG